VTSVALQCPKELRDLAWTGDSCPVGELDGRQCAAQIRRGIALDPEKRSRQACASSSLSKANTANTAEACVERGLRGC